MVDLKNSLERNLKSIEIFLDLAKPFDTVQHARLLGVILWY